jgi:phosphatidylglycerophosphate synthase
MNFLQFAGLRSTYNPLLKLLYLSAYPISIVFRKLGFTPNFITLCSFVLSIIAFYSLCVDKIYNFIFFWYLSYIFDFVDGTLARMTGNERTTALRVDHLSDLIKIALILLGLGIYFQDLYIWVILFISTTLFFFYAVLNHDLSAVKKINASKNHKGASNIVKNTIVNQSRVPNRSLRQTFSIYFKNTFFVIDGHTLIIFFFIPISKTVAFSFLGYFCLVLIYQSTCRIRDLSANPKV